MQNVLGWIKCERKIARNKKKRKKAATPTAIELRTVREKNTIYGKLSSCIHEKLHEIEKYHRLCKLCISSVVDMVFVVHQTN